MNQIAVICSEFNENLVKELYQSAKEEFKEHSQFFSSYYPQCELKTVKVPGAGEIPLAVQWLIEDLQKTQTVNLIAVLALGVIIKGQTGHYDFLNGLLQKALWDLQKTHSLPIVVSVLLLENRDQAKQRIVRAKESMNSLTQMIKLRHNLLK